MVNVKNKLHVYGLFQGILFLSGSCAYAGQPLTLSGPFPALTTLMEAGDEAIRYTYTVINHTAVPIALTQTISGNSTSVAITQACDVVPARGSCRFIATVTPSISDALRDGNIADIISVNYNGRLPAKLTSSVSVTVTEPTLESITVSPASTTILGGSYIPYTATGYYGNGAVLDITAYVTWASSNDNIATFPSPTTYHPLGVVFGVSNDGANGNSATITATRNSVSSSVNGTLTVNDYTYVTDNLAYVGTQIYYCPMNASGVTSCTLSDQVFGAPTSTAFNPRGTIAYVANSGSRSVSYCAVNASTGALSSCQSTGNGFQQPVGITVSNDNRFVYVADFNNGLISCSVNSSTGALSNCYQNSNTGISIPQAIALHPQKSYIYVSNAGYDIWRCSLDQDTGAISNCSVVVSNSNYANSLTIHPVGTYLYYASTGSNTVMYCPIESDGSLGTCLNGTGTNNSMLNSLRAISIQPNGEYIYVTANTNQLYSCPLVSNVMGTCVAQSSYTATYSEGVTVR